MTIGDKIKLARKEAGYTQKQLAELCKVATGTIQQYELGKRQPGLNQLEKIADALGKNIIELIGVEGVVEQSRNIRNNLDIKNLDIYDAQTDKNKSKQTVLLNHYNQLNEAGKDKAIERVEELTEIPRYTDKEE